MVRVFLTMKLAVIAALLLACAAARADDFGGAGDEYVPPPPKPPPGIGITEKLGAHLPLTLAFRDQTGRPVTLRDYFDDDLPVVLTFNYSNCTMLCSLQLSGLTKTLARLGLRAGTQFRIVTIDLDPNETTSRAAATRSTYLQRLAPEVRGSTERGWSFLLARTPGDDAEIHAAADAVGFHYAYVPESQQYAHPAGLILLSSRGAVTRYLGGTEYDADVLRDSIVKAGLSETSTSTGFFLTCFHGSTSTRSRSVIAALQAVTAGFLLLFAGAIAVVVVRRRRALRGAPAR